jgi:hypothetical protein
LIGRELRGDSPVSKEAELLFLDAILRLHAAAVLLLIDADCVELLRVQGGDDEARIGALLDMLGLTDDADLSIVSATDCLRWLRLRSASGSYRCLSGVEDNSCWPKAWARPVSM